MSDLICDIVVPIWNQPELTKRCIESVIARTEEPVRLILIDNGSEPETQELLEGFRQDGKVPVVVIRNEKNLGFIKAVNQGIVASRAPWVCLLNNDTVVTTGWLTEMIYVGELDPGIGLLNPTSNCMGYPDEGQPPEEIAKKIAGEHGHSTPLSTAVGFCLLAKKSLYDQIGLLDEQFGMGNFDDDDLTLRARQAGFRAARALASYVHHEGKASFKKLPDWEKAFDHNRTLFEKKWGRKLRILWGPSVPPSFNLELIAGAGHWVSVAGPRNGIAEQAQVDYLGYTEPGWRGKAAWRLIAKRKKPFDLVVSHDPSWSRWIKRLKPLHRAKLLDNPTEKELLEECQTLSRSLSSS